MEVQAQSQRQAQQQQEAEARAVEAAKANQAQFLETLDAASEAPLPGYAGAAQHAKEQGSARSSWQGAARNVAVASRAVNAFASATATASKPKQAPIQVGSKVGTSA